MCCRSSVTPRKHYQLPALLDFLYTVVVVVVDGLVLNDISTMGMCTIVE